MMESDVRKILDKTDDGLNVFTHYLGEVRKGVTFRNPYRDDARPSCRLYYRKNRQGVGKWYMKDYGDSDWCGDCFWLVSTVCHLDLRNNFRDILHVIDKELNLFILDDTLNQDINYTKMERREVQPSQYRQSKIVGFQPVFQHFTPSELKFWDRYGITEETLNRYNVRSIKSCVFTREDGTTYKECSSPSYPVFAYVNAFPLYFPDGKKVGEDLQGMKIYRPRNKRSRFMYVGVLPKPYMFGDKSWLLDTTQKENVIYVTGGEKDTLALLSHGFHALCLNSETARVSATWIESMLRKHHWVAFLYDCDATGKKESEARVAEFRPRFGNIIRVDLPLAGTKTEKDVSDFFALGHTPDELVALTLDAQCAAKNYKNQDIYEDIDQDKHPGTE